MTKSQYFHFSKFLRIFRQTFERLRELEIFERQQGKDWLFSSFFRSVYCIFLNANVSNAYQK